MVPLSDNFIHSLSELPGVDTARLTESLDTPPEVSIRRNSRKTEAGTDVLPKGERVEWCENGTYLSERPVFTLDPAFHAGAYYVQDASSMIYSGIVAELVARLKRDTDDGARLTALDFCAAPGGKTTAIIDALPDGSIVVANEYVAARGKILRENLEKWGYPYVITTGSGSDTFAGLPAMFDIVAVDAPCSGEGMMRKDEDARTQWSEGLVVQCAALQKQILRDVASTVRPGGYLIYSTCTFNLSEDEMNSLFIRDELGLQPVGIHSLGLPGTERVSKGLLIGVEALRFMPHLTRGEGLYVSVFRRPEDGTEISAGKPGPILASGKSAKGKQKWKGDGRQPAIDTDKLRILNGMVAPGIEWSPEISGNLVTMLPEACAPIVGMLRRHGVNVTGAGLPMAEIKSNGRKTEVIPDSRFALNNAMHPEAFPRAALSHGDALRYLRRESIVLGPNIPKGYAVVEYKGLPLGMVKNLGTRANNLYPVPWRIKMELPNR